MRRLVTATTDIDQGAIGIYDSMEDATAAVRRLGEADFPIEHVSIITQNLESTTDVHGFIRAGDVAKSGAGVGAWVGGIFGLLTGVALLIVPGAGPLLVAGSLASAVLGGAEGAAGGAAVGGLVGAATGHFVAKRHLPKLTEHLQAGRFLLIVQIPDETELARAKDLLAGQAVDVVDSTETT